MNLIWLNSMIFPDDNSASAMDAGVPILGSFNGFKAIEFTNTFRSPVDELPGAGAIGSHLAPVFPGTAAGTVKHMFCAPGYEADAAVFMENT
jgi:hypothetical protein